jgi:hypothetical protein
MRGEGGESEEDRSGLRSQRLRRRWLALWLQAATLPRRAPPLRRCVGASCLRFQCNVQTQIIHCAYCGMLRRPTSAFSLLFLSSRWKRSLRRSSTQRKDVLCRH